jgi:hypothetical protein
MASKSRSWHRQQAMQIAMQLPEEREDAQIIIDYIQRDLVKFLYGPEPVLRRANTNGHQRVLSFPFGSASSRRRARSIGKASILPK